VDFFVVKGIAGVLYFGNQPGAVSMRRDVVEELLDLVFEFLNAFLDVLFFLIAFLDDF